MSPDKDQGGSPQAHGGNGRAVHRRPARGHQELPGSRGRAGAASSASARWFAIDYSSMDRVSLWLDTRMGGGVEVDPAVLRVRMADFHLDIPRGSMRSATRSSLQTRGTIGVHARRGSWLVKGSHDGLVELVIDPPCYLPRQLSTVFRKMEVRSLIISLVDPDGFIAAVQRNGSHP
jgi:hypothetical protein